VSIEWWQDAAAQDGFRAGISAARRAISCHEEAAEKIAMSARFSAIAAGGIQMDDCPVLNSHRPLVEEAAESDPIHSKVA
jgi:hypothetical protein